jgi:TonB family C-terminal domain
MSFIDGNSENARSKALTGGAIALLQAGIAIALVKGFTVAFIDAEPPRHLPSQFFPTKPVPPTPIETPEVVQEKPLPRESFIDTPKPRLELPTPPRTDVIVPLDTPRVDSFQSGSRLVDVPSVKPSQPTELFTPKKATPRGDTAAWVTTNDYPASDLRAGHTGKVRFQLAIDAAGRVTGCTIVESSGYAGLDAATCRHVVRRARFESATDSSGGRIPGTYSATIQWVIPRD